MRPRVASGYRPSQRLFEVAALPVKAKVRGAPARRPPKELRAPSAELSVAEAILRDVEPSPNLSASWSCPICAASSAARASSAAIAKSALGESP